MLSGWSSEKDYALRFYYSTWLRCLFPTDQNGQTKLICTSEVPAVKGQIGGPDPSIFSHDS